MYKFEPYSYDKRDSMDLSLCSSGFESCVPGKEVGPAAYDYYIIHFIVNGCGKYIYGDKAYDIKEGQAFIIFPGDIVRYIPDQLQPWSYYWVGFKGRKISELITANNELKKIPVFTYDSCIINEVKDVMGVLKQSLSHDLKDYALLAHLYKILYYIRKDMKICEIDGKEQQKSYLQYAINYIEKYYYRELTIQEIADFVHIDRTYLYQIFKKQTGDSPKEFLIKYRIHKACYLMKATDTTVTKVASLVGYKDYSLFSRMFKKTIGISPQSYKEQI
ncbi:AraC family transcriptional regulator [Vallitalea okinawensis]|uniref:AraC family transcriptional regulator n=1 Tax=Vallitalea okinawensis TaxID=2078660 RepID=UPI000CFDF85D|nr:AraC family transcriptional regulator [Vallitalea okinawensis]